MTQGLSKSEEGGNDMAICIVCGKQRVIGNNVSHANNRTKRVVMPNLQKMRIMTDHGIRKVDCLYQMSAVENSQESPLMTRVMYRADSLLKSFIKDLGIEDGIGLSEIKTALECPVQ